MSDIKKTNLTVAIYNIPYATTDEELIAFVKEQKLAVPADIKILRTANGKSKGRAFYVCENDAQIDEVCTALNGKTLGERQLKVRRFPQLVEDKRVVLVKNIPRTMTKEAYEDAVKDFGVPEPTTFRYRTVSHNRGRGTMVFKTEEDAKNAVAAVDKKPFGGRSARARQLRSKNTVVAVGNIPFKMQDEEFSKTIADLGVKPESECVLFPHCVAVYKYSSEEDAEKALAAFAEKKLSENELHAKHPVSRKPSDAKRTDSKKPSGDFVTLRVTNLPKGIADADVVDIFRGAKVAGTKLEDQKSTVVAFVDFKTENDARAAFQLVKGTSVDGKPLRITLLRYSTPRKTATALPETSIRVYNVPFASNADAVVAALKEYGAVSARILHSRFGKSRGTAIVDFGSVEDCKRAASAEVTLEGRTLRFHTRKVNKEGKKEEEKKEEEKKEEKKEENSSNEA